MLRQGAAFLAALAMGTAPGPALAQTATHQVFSFNDLGMHCYDSSFAEFAILPPYNVVRGQVILRGQHPVILDNTQVNLTYRAAADPTGSINTTSRGKTNFWRYVQQLFGVSLPIDVGLKGARMPGANNQPQPFEAFDAQKGWFAAEGIPITAKDNNKLRNPLSLMRVEARDAATDVLLSSLDTVVPASDEMNCSNCHFTGRDAADAAIAQKYNITVPWSSSPVKAVMTKENIMILHDAVNQTNLSANRPVLCASCHYSAALDLEGQGPQGAQVGKPFLSHAIHSHHGMTVNHTLPDPDNPAIVSGNTSNACYQCHPGKNTKCLRGAMATAGLNCQNCHGGMLAVGGVFHLKTTGQPRRPWIDLPKCGSCHTGDALNHQGVSLILRLAYQRKDPAATPRNATNKRFAENDNTLYRFSLGHHGVACESCHGSPHAEWPTRPGTNDNLTAEQIQGHTGPIIECTVCHGDNLPRTMGGPHGLHNVDDRDWNQFHMFFFFQDNNNCKTCHGANLEGTVLSRAAADRNLIDYNHNPKFVPKGTIISCTLCHRDPRTF
ncbi:MAG: cytochrome C [Deltaproteobacteria bacterium]|nr:MAG: cytochrome C [Deltaproteobacteria bacterium]